MLERRRYRRKLLEEFQKGSAIDKPRKSPKLSNSMTDGKPIISGRYVCAMKSPQFSVHGLPTHKMLED